MLAVRVARGVVCGAGIVRGVVSVWRGLARWPYPGYVVLLLLLLLIESRVSDTPAAS
jgi:hypothetical protein